MSIALAALMALAALVLTASVTAAEDPVEKDDCKKGGWEAYGFRNQGLCIAFLNAGIDMRDGPGGEPEQPTAPDDLDGLVLWLDASTLGDSLDDGDPVAIWDDQSGTDSDAVLASGTTPEFVETSLVDGPAVRFDEDDALLVEGLAHSDEVTIFVVAAYADLPSANPGLIHGAPDGDAFSTQPGDKSIGIWVSDAGDLWGRLIDDSTTHNFPQNASLAADTGYVITLRAGGTDGEQFVDGVEVGTVTYSGTLQDWSDFGIGRQGSESWDGDIAEVIVYDRALTDEEREEVEAYLAEKHGLD